MMNKFLLLIITGCLGLTLATGQNIYTKAGTGNFGDFASALNTRFLGPTDIALDASGNIFVVDGLRVRRINAADGKIYPVAGIGVFGYSGDGGPATAAKMQPGGIALNAKGDLFVTDIQGHRVRKVSAADGKITCIAGNGVGGFSGDGGAATDAQLNYPYDVAVDAAGNVYIADGYNLRIRKVDAVTGKISTVAGTGNWGFSGDGGLAASADLSVVNSLALDAAGNLYFTDIGNYRIRKITAADGKISTVAGNGDYGYLDAGEGGPAVAAAIGEPVRVTVDDKNNIFFSDINTDNYVYRVRKVNSTDGTIHIVAGTGSGYVPFQGDGGLARSAPLNSPNGVGVDKTGNLFIADGQNARLRKVNATDQIISTIAGIGGYNYGGGIGVLVGDAGPAALGRLQFAAGTAVDANGNVYVLDNGNNSVRKINAADGIITTIAGDGSPGFSGDGGPAKAAKLTLSFSNRPPGAIITDKAGNIYFSDLVNYRIRKINVSDGTISTIAGTGGSAFLGDGGQATAAGIGMVYGMALDSKGDLYFVSSSIFRVRKINMTTGIISTVVGNGLTYGGRTGATSGDGGLATAARMMSPLSIAIDGNDNIYFGETFARIRKVNAADGMISTIAGTGTLGFSGENEPAISAQLNSPVGLAIHANDLYIADQTDNFSDPLLKNHLIRKIDLTTGIITTVAGHDRGFAGDGGLATLSKLDHPASVTLDGKGNLFLTDQGNDRVRYICYNEVLSAGNMKDTRAAYPEDTTSKVYFNNSCTVICDLIPEGEHPVTGFMTGKVWIANNVLLSNDRPYVQRHYEIAPELNAATATGTVNLYFTQAEFDAYNTGAKVADGAYLPLPVNAADAVNKQNLRIVYAKGVSSDNSGLLSTYSGDTTVIIPSIEWDAAKNWWKISFSAEGLGGFFVTSLKVPIPAADHLFVPNMFSPNADGKNDFLLVYGNHLNTVRLLVFNQWGQKVFETRNGNTNGWDGSAGGKPQPVGVYIYVLEAKLDDGTVLKRKGSISLIR